LPLESKTHYKATFEKAENHTLFYIGDCLYWETGAEIKEKFNSFNVDFNHFKNYIQEIDVPNELETVVIIKGIENEEKVKAHFEPTDHTFIIRENEPQLGI